MNQTKPRIQHFQQTTYFIALLTMHLSFLTTKFFFPSRARPYFSIQQLSNFSKMNHSRSHGLHNSRRSTPRRRLETPSQEKQKPVLDTSDEQNWPLLNASSTTKQPKRATPVMGPTACAPVMCSGNIMPHSIQIGSLSIPLSSGNQMPQLPITESMHATQPYSMDGPLQNGRGGVMAKSSPVFSLHPLENTMGNTSPVGSMNGISQLKETSATKESVNNSHLQPLSMTEPSKSACNKARQHHSPRRSWKVMPQSTNISPKQYHHSSSHHIRPFDICQPRHGISAWTSSILEKNKERWKYNQILKNDPRPSFLRPGMVLLKNYISCDDQIKIVKTCRKLGIGPGGFYQPCFSNGAKLRLYMMCLGKDWDPQGKSYGDFRFIDGASPPTIPDAFRKLVTGAIQASHAVIENQCVRNPDDFIPWMQPDICIVNFYTKSGKLGLHQDRDESLESIKKGLPVVSFSIGDSAEFLYGDERDVNKAEKVELKSGDVLIFGGESRLVFHGVTAIIPDSAPKFLANEAHLLPGRLNLTFREY